MAEINNNGAKLKVMAGLLATLRCSLRNIQLQPTGMSAQIVLSKRYEQHSALKKKTVFKPIPNTVESDTGDFKNNLNFNKALEEKYNQLIGVVSKGGGDKAIERHVVKNKKILVLERLKQLFDDAEDVLELSSLAGIGMPYGDIASAGIIIVIGRIQGVHCMVVANDATVKGGTLFPITVKKQLRAQEIAETSHLPSIYVMDSGGAFLPLQADIFTNGGRGFYNEAILNSKSIPQLAVVCGSCTAGAAYVPTMSQEAVIVDRIGTIFLGGPPLVYAALGEIVSSEELGGGRMHSSVSGCTDYFSGTEEEAFLTSRDVVATFNIDPPDRPSGYDEPACDPEELLGIIPKANQHTMDMYQVIARIVDGSRFHEFKAMYGTSLVTGFTFLQGYLVGILGNNGVMTEQAALKGSHFVQLCSQRNIPIIFLQNSSPDTELLETVGTSGLWEEAGKTLRAHAQLMSSVACADVPKLTVIVGNSFGGNNFMMCGRSFDPRFVFCWPNAKICMFDPSEIHHHLSHNSIQEESSSGKLAELTALLEKQSSAFYSTSQNWDDGVILPRQTRQVLGRCLEIVNQVKGVDCRTVQRGVLRM